MDNIPQIVSEFSDCVFRLVRRIVGDRDQALDLTQETFIKVLCYARRPSEDRALKAYIVKSAYNLALNHKRNVGRRQSKLETYAREYDAPGRTRPDEVFEREETSAHLERAMELLPEKQREVVALRFHGELSMAEIAAALKIKEGSVKVHLARGLNKLRDLTKDILSEERS